METAEQHGRMWADLLTSELRWQAERHAVTTRGLFYVEAGLPLDKVLDALKISRATWYRRVADLEANRAANRAAADQAAADKED